MNRTCPRTYPATEVVHTKKTAGRAAGKAGEGGVSTDLGGGRLETRSDATQALAVTQDLRQDCRLVLCSTVPGCSTPIVI